MLLNLQRTQDFVQRQLQASEILSIKDATPVYESGIDF